MTARALHHACRKVGIILTADGDDITFQAPPDAVVPADEIRRIKPELLAVLRGDYLNAAMALVLSVPDPARQEAMVEAFDERAGICEYDGNMSRGEAERRAYLELARTIEACGAEYRAAPGGEVVTVWQKLEGGQR